MFDDVRLPIDVERGAQGGPGFLTNIVTLASGKEQRNKEWELERGRWNIGYGIQRRGDLNSVYNFFMARNGRFRAFRFRDWLDFTLDAELCAPVQALSGDVLRQIVKTYHDTVSPYVRPIIAPRMDTIKVYIDGLETTDYVYAGGGILKFPQDPGPNVHVTGEFDVVARFDIDDLSVTLNTFREGAIPSIPIVELKFDTFDFIHNGWYIGSALTDYDEAEARIPSEYIEPSADIRDTDTIDVGVTRVAALAASISDTETFASNLDVQPAPTGMVFTTGSFGPIVGYGVPPATPGPIGTIIEGEVSTKFDTVGLYTVDTGSAFVLVLELLGDQQIAATGHILTLSDIGTFNTDDANTISYNGTSTYIEFTPLSVMAVGSDYTGLLVRGPQPIRVAIEDTDTLDVGSSEPAPDGATITTAAFRGNYIGWTLPGYPYTEATEEYGTISGSVSSSYTVVGVFQDVQYGELVIEIDGHVLSSFTNEVLTINGVEYSVENITGFSNEYSSGSTVVTWLNPNDPTAGDIWTVAFD